jgi:hypothetical protein
MLSKFFTRRPKKGDSVASLDVLALARMDHAWATLDCLGGDVSWSPDGRPTIIPPGSGGGGSFDVRGTEELFRAVTDRAYLTADDSLVAHGTAYNSETMYLYPTWDWIRWPEPEGS